MQQLTHIISKGNPWKSTAACLQRLYGVKISKEEVLLVDAVPYTALNAKNQGRISGEETFLLWLSQLDTVCAEPTTNN